MAWCLREHCVPIPPTQLYRCLKFTGVSLRPGNTHQFSVGRHFLWAEISTWSPKVLTWTNVGLFGRIHIPDVTSPTCCLGSCLLGVPVRDVTPVGYRVRQKQGIKLWAGEMGVTSHCSPPLHLWPLFSHHKVRVIFHNLLSSKEQNVALAVVELQFNFSPK